ncbi:hypothetical protein VDG1235_1011 [Verrucomicrobiia bacterium DG1235]|nr:hypothetical protein VDG1235_1011 [Verrucomicrobiae bacterium DG1235]
MFLGEAGGKGSAFVEGAFAGTVRSIGRSREFGEERIAKSVF